MQERLSPAIAANRFGLGAKPAELAEIGSQPRDWLYAQLSGAPPLLTGPELHSSAETLARGLEVRRELDGMAETRAAPGLPDPRSSPALQRRRPEELKPPRQSATPAAATCTLLISRNSPSYSETQSWIQTRRG